MGEESLGRRKGPDPEPSAPAWGPPGAGRQAGSPTPLLELILTLVWPCSVPCVCSPQLWQSTGREGPTPSYTEPPAPAGPSPTGGTLRQTDWGGL